MRLQILAKQLLGRTACAGLLALALLGLTATNAAAVPAFAVQTGEPCQACHVGGFGPQLTPFGREFKLQGYTLRTKSFNVPFSVAATVSYLNTQKSQTPAPAGFSGNDNFALDQINFFFASGFGQHLGAFVQATYDGISKAWTWDNLDVRAVDSFKVKDADVTVGASLNNSPTVQDAWNTLSAWGFPYTSSELAPAPATSPLLSGALAQTTLGITGYAWINSEFYVEGGAYWSPSASLLTHLGVDPTDPGDIRGVAPYGRLAFQHDLAGGTVELGLFGLQAEIYPGLDQTTGLADRYTDVGLDGSYQYSFASTDVVSLNGRFTHEDQSLQATCALAEADPSCAANTVDELRIDASYYWRDKIGLTVQGFDTTGSANSVLYAGNRTLRPDSSGVMVQLDATPWGDGKSPFGKRFNTRVGVQYTAYTQFNGAASNWDGMGSNARDNNTLRVFVWAAY